MRFDSIKIRPIRSRSLIASLVVTLATHAIHPTRGEEFAPTIGLSDIETVVISPTGPGDDAAFAPAPFSPEMRALNDRSMQIEAQLNANNPVHLIYVEYNGIKYPLKGWVKVRSRRFDGTIERRPLDEFRREAFLRERASLQSTQAQIEQQANPLINEIRIETSTIKRLSEEQNAVAERIGELSRAIDEAAAEQPQVAAQLSEARAAKEQQAREIFLAQERLQIKQIRLDALREGEAQRNARLAEINERIVLGEPLYVPMRIDQGKYQHVPTIGARGVWTEAEGTEGTIGVVTISPKQPMGTSDVRQVISNGVAVARPKFALPAALNSNDLFQSPLLDPRETRMGKERMLNSILASEALENLGAFADFRANPSFGFAYDTRVPNSLIAPGIKGLSTSRTPADGQTTFIGNDIAIAEQNVPLNLLFDTQVFDAKIPGVLPGSNEQQLQFFIETNNYEDSQELKFRNAYGRIYDKGGISLAAGKTQTLFGTGALLPQSLEQQLTLIGTGELGNENVLQLRFQQNFPTGSEDDFRGWGWGFGIEDPNFASGEFSEVPAAAGTILTRWPSLSGQLRFTGANGIDTLQIGSLVRNVGMQLASDGTEQFETAWGLSLFSAMSLLDNGCYQCSAVGWFAGGDGVGRYINGIDKAAGFNAGTLTLLDGHGGFIGIQQRWVGRRFRWLFSSNAAFGYTSLDTESFLSAETNRQLQQAFANLYVKPNDYLQFGFEWQYGRRETLGDGTGNNNRIFAGLTLVTSPTQKTKDVTVDVDGAQSFTDRQLIRLQGVRGERAQRQRL